MVYAPYRKEVRLVGIIPKTMCEGSEIFLRDSFARSVHILFYFDVRHSLAV